MIPTNHFLVSTKPILYAKRLFLREKIVHILCFFLEHFLDFFGRKSITFFDFFGALLGVPNGVPNVLIFGVPNVLIF